MNDERFEKINYITGVFSGCLGSLEDEEFDKLYKQAEDFHSERTEKSREFAHKLIDKFLGGELQMNELQEKLEKLKAEKWDNATIEEKVDMLRDEIRQIAEKIELQESQKAQMSALNGMLNTIPLHHVLKY